MRRDYNGEYKKMEKSMWSTDCNPTVQRYYESYIMANFI